MWKEEKGEGWRKALGCVSREVRGMDEEKREAGRQACVGVSGSNLSVCLGRD